MENIRLVLEPNYSEIRIARKEFRDAANRNSIGFSDECDMELVIGELLANVIDHGMDEGNFAPIYFYMGMSDSEIIFEMKYKGKGVTNDDIAGYKEIKEVDDIEELSEHGRGLFIMHNIMDEIDYQYEDGIAKVRLIKKINK